MYPDKSQFLDHWLLSSVILLAGESHWQRFLKQVVIIDKADCGK
jgi:hypothetical protein